MQQQQQHRFTEDQWKPRAFKYWTERENESVHAHALFKGSKNRIVSTKFCSLKWEDSVWKYESPSALRAFCWTLRLHVEPGSASRPTLPSASTNLITVELIMNFIWSNQTDQTLLDQGGASLTLQLNLCLELFWCWPFESSTNLHYLRLNTICPDCSWAAPQWQTVTPQVSEEEIPEVFTTWAAPSEPNTLIFTPTETLLNFC